MVDDELKQFRKELEAAINEALTESPQVSEVIREIRQRGFDVFLIIEATIGFSRHNQLETAEPKQLPAVRLDLTSQDESFLRSLKISPR